MPITFAVSKAVGCIAAQWKHGDIDAKEFCDKAQVELDKLGELEKRLAIAEGGLDAAYLSGFHKRDDEVRELKEICDWAETLLCNAAPMSHCTQEDWDAVLKRWRDQKHGVKGGSDAQP